jgi:hypothetical protein
MKTDKEVKDVMNAAADIDGCHGMSYQDGIQDALMRMSKPVYIVLNETDGNEFFYILGAFNDLEEAITAVQALDLDTVAYIDDVCDINIREFTGMTRYENSKFIESYNFKKEYDEDEDDYLWVML